MYEDGPVGMQADAAVRVGTWCTVFEVALDGAAHVGQLAAYLVVPACEQLHFEQGVAFGTLHETVAQPGQLGALGALAHYVALILLFVARQPVFQQALLVPRFAAAQGQVDLVHGAFPEHGCHALQGLGCLGKDHYSAHRTVESVGNAQEHIAGLAVALLDEGLEILGEGSVAGTVALDYLSRLFIENQKVIVFVENTGCYVGKVHDAL